MSLLENCNLIKDVQRDILHSLKKQGSFEETELYLPSIVAICTLLKTVVVSSSYIQG